MSISKWIRNLCTGLMVTMVVAVGATAQPVTTAPSTQLTTKASTVEASRKLTEKGIQQALDGQFESAYATLRRAVDRAPDDSTAQKAFSLLKEYLDVRRQSEADRRAEYEYEIKRIRWAMLAQDYLDTFGKDKTIATLREKINEELSEAYLGIGTASGFEEASTTEATEMKQTSLSQINQAQKVLFDAKVLLEGEKSPYAEEFRREVKTLKQRLVEAAEIWKQLDPSTVQSRWRGARRLRGIQDDLNDAITDVEVMVAKKPWKLALLHGQLAREIAPDPEHVPNQLWYVDLVRAGAEQGQQAVENAEWYDALTAYSALKELAPTNHRYKEELDKVRRHVRVLRLYGKDQTDDGDEEDDASQSDDEPAWENLVHGADAQMVRKAISKLGRNYVESVDFARLTRGAIESVKVLAMTPQVAETFPGLKDDEDRRQFIQALDEEIRDVSHKDRVDHVRLQMALNKVIYTSQKTVKIPLEVLVVEFADGFLDRLDKFSSMIWPSDVTEFNKSTMGHFTGIGVQITKEPGEPLKVVTPLLDTPAYRAGIKAGDLIVEVDGKKTAPSTVDKLIKRIMGPPDTKVVLTIKRRGRSEPLKIPVIRQPVHIRTVKGWQRKENGEWTYLLDPSRKIAYVKITQFTDTTHEDLQDAFEEMKLRGVNSMVLDLRANPGGLLRSATAVADEFLQDGRRIVFTRGRQIPRSEVDATGDGSYLEGDVVLLVDEHSASAAEILSGAVKDWNRGLIVGERSYGKGSVQNVIPLRLHGNKAFLKLTTAYYYLPSGRLLHRTDDASDWGVTPDVEIAVTPRQGRRWIELRRKADLLQKVDPELLAADLQRQFEADLQLSTGVLMLELLRLKEQLETKNLYAADQM